MHLCFRPAVFNWVIEVTDRIINDLIVSHNGIVIIL